MKDKIKQKLIDKVYKENIFGRLFLLLLGITILSITFNLLILPNDIVFGGVTGISILIKNIIDPSLFILIADVVLLVVSFIFLGKRTTYHSILGSLLFPVFIKLTSGIGSLIYVDMSDKLLIVLFAGVLYGLGVGLVFKAGYTTGGTDILNQIFSKYVKTSIGTAMIAVDGLIVVCGLFSFGWANFMYAILMLYIISIMTDKVLLGISDKKAFYIITEKKNEISDFVISELNHSVTIFDAKGGYTQQKQKMLFAVIPTKDYFKLKEGIRMIDPDAFFVATDAYEVQGGE